MPLDPSIALQGGLVPDLLAAARGGVSLGQSIREMPFRRELMQQQIDMNKQGLLGGQLDMQSRKQQMQEAQAESARNLAIQRGQIANRFAQQLKTLPQDQRQAALQQNRSIFDQLGMNVDRFTDLSDASLNNVIASTQAFVPQGKVATVGAGERLIDTSSGRLIAEGGEKPKNTESLIKDLRSRYDKFTGDLRDVDAAYRKINGAPQTAAGDISLLFSFMKLNDPGSTVREGEFATAQNAAGVPTRILNLYNQALEGTRLSPAQRDEFKATANQLFSAQQESADSAIEDLLNQADEDDISRQRVIGARALKEFNQRKRERASAQPASVGEMSDEDLLSF